MTEAGGVCIEVERLEKCLPGGATLLDDISFTVAPSEVLAIVGGSGAGKTTLLDAIAGKRPATNGSVLYDGVDLSENLDRFRSVLGYVPQDDIIHTELPLDRTLRHAARLRLSDVREVDDLVAGALADLDLTERADVRVGALSGGQRKRASIAVELLTRPRVFFLDEPTSGLDSASSVEVMGVLRRLADAGSTIVLTTHSLQDLAHCDRIVFLTQGCLAFAGAEDEARAYFEVETLEKIYERLATEGTATDWARRFREHDGAITEPAARTQTPPEARRPVGAFRQFNVLTRRTLDTIIRNPLTLAILLGSPLLVVAMFAVLFRPGAFVFENPSPSAIVMILYWISFAGFFFGLTYGLLQICTETAIVQREWLVGLRLGPYVLSKVAVLAPFLLAIVVVMLAVLRGLDRMPAADLTTYLSIGVTLFLDALAALSLGLLTSAAVSNPSQATLALPMLCFPAVLFSGAILPVKVMADAGKLISAVMVDRWAFEAVGHDLGVRRILEEGGSPLGPPLVDSYGDGAAAYATGTYWVFLGIFIVVFLVACWVVLAWRCRQGSR